MSDQDDSSSAEEEECPLCMEALGEDDKNFFPCSCRYQICRFCWHRIRNDENGLCPACRKEYSDTPAEYNPMTMEEMQKLREEKKAKKTQKKAKELEIRRHLANVRVVQKNLVYVIGLPHRMVNNEAALRKNDMFGKYGKILKVVINKNNHYNSGPNPTVSAYVTYSRKEDAANCVRCIDKTIMDGRQLRASLGTTKYCSNFLRNQPCPNPDCMYLHELGSEAYNYQNKDMLEELPAGVKRTAERSSSGPIEIPGGRGGGGLLPTNSWGSPNVAHSMESRGRTQSFDSTQEPKPSSSWVPQSMASSFTDRPTSPPVIEQQVPVPQSATQFPELQSQPPPPQQHDTKKQKQEQQKQQKQQQKQQQQQQQRHRRHRYRQYQR
eukprot:m.241677 g.241677  ORF g.241677 m.241677 type:complete len:380 (-) comp33779_c9_seq1:177-1316(-)